MNSPSTRRQAAQAAYDRLQLSHLSNLVQRMGLHAAPATQGVHDTRAPQANTQTQPVYTAADTAAAHRTAATSETNGRPSSNQPEATQPEPPNPASRQRRSSKQFRQHVRRPSRVQVDNVGPVERVAAAGRVPAEPGSGSSSDMSEIMIEPSNALVIVRSRSSMQNLSAPARSQTPPPQVPHHHPPSHQPGSAAPISTSGAQSARQADLLHRTIISSAQDRTSRLAQPAGAVGPGGDMLSAAAAMDFNHGISHTDSGGLLAHQARATTGAPVGVSSFTSTHLRVRDVRDRLAALKQQVRQLRRTLILQGYSSAAITSALGAESDSEVTADTVMNGGLSISEDPTELLALLKARELEMMFLQYVLLQYQHGRAAREDAVPVYLPEASKICTAYCLFNVITIPY